MKNLRTLLLIGCLACLGTALVPKAKADEWDQKTIITFSQPVQLPGIVLPAGTYVFRLLDYNANNNMVQVLSKDEQKTYALIRAIPDYRVNPKDESSIIFEERYAGAPRAIKEWFFPDNHYGHEFVYPKAEALALAKAEEPDNTSKPAESAEVQPTRNEPADASEPAIQPAETQPPQEPQQQEAEVEQLQQQEQAPPEGSMAMELPKTASVLPLTGLIGMILLAGALGLRFYSKPD